MRSGEEKETVKGPMAKKYKARVEPEPPKLVAPSVPELEIQIDPSLHPGPDRHMLLRVIVREVLKSEN